MTYGHCSALAIRMVAAGVLLSAILPAAIRKKTVSAEPSREVAPAAAAGRVNNIRFSSAGGLTRITVEVTNSYKLQSNRLRNPDRLFFDIGGIKPQSSAKGIESIPVGDSNLKQIRVAETHPGTTRIVLDLQAEVEYTAFQLTEPDRLLIELRPPASALSRKPASERELAARPERAPPVNVPAATIPPAPLRGVVSDPSVVVTPVEVPPKESLPRTTAAPEIATPRQVLDPPAPAKRVLSGADPSLIRVLGLKLGKVVIDPGHGGHDVGTSGSAGLLEKELVLDVSQRLATLVETRLGSEVVMTRNDDRFVGLEHRTQIANDAKADLFISVHANSSPVKSVSGTETYYLNFTTSKAAMEVAARENAASSHSIYDLKDIVQKIALKEKVDESREFAARVQSALSAQSVKNNAASRDRGVKKAPFVVLIGASMPSILAEIGFITNTKDEAMLKKGEYRQKIAEALFRGLSQYASGLSHFQVAQRKNGSE